MPHLHIIAAVASNFAIGLRGNLLYHLPADLRRFKDLTTSHTVLMGRKTFQSLPKGALPNRRNIVLSATQTHFPCTEVFPDLATALAHCAADEHIYIIGGAAVYAEALPIADAMHLTHIAHTPTEADVYFPRFDASQWRETEREHHPVDERHSQAFDFVTYQRNSHQ